MRLWSPHFHQPSKYNLVLCVFQFKGTLFNLIVSSLTLTSPPPALQLTPERSLSDTMFSPRRVTASLHSGTRMALQHFAWGHFNQRDHQQNRKNHASKQTVERTPVTVRADIKAEHPSPCENCAGNVHSRPLKFFTALHKSTDKHESAGSTDLGASNTFYQVDKCTNTDLRIIRIDCVFIFFKL